MTTTDAPITTTESPSLSTTIPSLTPQEQDVATVVVEAELARLATLAGKAAGLPDLATWFTGTSLDKVQAQIDRFRREGVLRLPDPQSPASVDIVEVVVSGSTAVALGCLQDQATVVHQDTLEDLDQGSFSRSFGMELTIESGRWKIADSWPTEMDGTSCDD